MRTGLLLLLLTACTAQPSYRRYVPAANTPLTAATVPVHVVSYVQQQWPGWRLCSHQDYDKSFWSFYDSTTLPFYAAVDINDDTRTDYSLLLRNGQQLRLVFLLSTGDSFTYQLADNIPATVKTSLSYGLLPEPPGQIDVAYPAIQSLLLTTNAISLMYMENRYCIYYWDGRQVATFKTM